eukprot:8849508-Ditylum_brightwellii.AAC.1
MICKSRNNSAQRIAVESQLAFHVKGKGTGDKETKEEVVPPAGGGKVRPYIQCNKCNKKGHYANKCPEVLENKEEELSAFIIKEDKDPNNKDSDGGNEFIFLTTHHKTVNKNMLLLDNQSSTNIICNRRYVTNTRK